MSEKVLDAWAYVTISITIAPKVDDKVIDALTKWYGRKYPSPDRSWGCERDRTIDGEFEAVRLVVYKTYSPHSVAKKVEKKINKLIKQGRETPPTS